MNAGLAKLLIFAGVILILAGLLIYGQGRLHLFSWFGRLPGDIHVAGRNGQFHFPVVSCLLLSLLLALLFNLWRFWVRR